MNTEMGKGGTWWDGFSYKFAKAYHFLLNLAGYLAISKFLLDWIWKGDDYGLFRSLIVVYLPIGLLTIWAVIKRMDGHYGDPQPPILATANKKKPLK